MFKPVAITDCHNCDDRNGQKNPGNTGEFRTRALLAVPGIGPWTASYVAMRALGDPDVFLEGDLGVRKAAALLGLPRTPRALAEHARRWGPWRSYAVLHLWASLTSPWRARRGGR